MRLISASRMRICLLQCAEGSTAAELSRALRSAPPLARVMPARPSTASCRPLGPLCCTAVAGKHRPEWANTSTATAVFFCWRPVAASEGAASCAGGLVAASTTAASAAEPALTGDSSKSKDSCWHTEDGSSAAHSSGLRLLLLRAPSAELPLPLPLPRLPMPPAPPPSRLAVAGVAAGCGRPSLPKTAAAAPARGVPRRLPGRERDGCISGWASMSRRAARGDVAAAAAKNVGCTSAGLCRWIGVIRRVGVELALPPPPPPPPPAPGEPGSPPPAPPPPRSSRLAASAAPGAGSRTATGGGDMGRVMSAQLRGCTCCVCCCCDCCGCCDMCCCVSCCATC